ncbi:MAG: Rrf2 family transcriptional regulator [Proteobacteria bacterium]|nr:Rrf2 family transcriptional regulator [Pseudomonadota bacterium]
MLSMKAKYAIRALIVLAKNPNKTLQTKTIAKDADAPQKFLETILLDLKNHGIVASKRGVFGGYYLSHAPKDILVGNIIRIIDGPLAPIRCASITAYQKCDDCVDEKTCEIRKVMLEVRNAISGVLDDRSLAEMMQ